MTPRLAIAFVVRALSGNVRLEGDADALEPAITLEAAMNAATGAPMGPGHSIRPTVLVDVWDALKVDGDWVAPAFLMAWADAQKEPDAFTRRAPGDPPIGLVADRVVLTRAGWTATEAFLNCHVVHPFPDVPTWEDVWSGDDPPASEPVRPAAFEDPVRPDGIGSQVAVLAVDPDTGGVIVRITWGGPLRDAQDGLDVILWPGEAVAFFASAGALIRRVDDPTRGLVEWKT
jgi:hypothetical protein